MELTSLSLFLIKTFGYLGILGAGIISSATIFFPIPLYLIIFFSTSLGLNPLAVGLLAGLGNAVGELTGYFVGLGGTTFVEERKKKTPKFYFKFLRFFENYGFIVIFLAAFLPFPFDIVGMMSGAAKYDLKKFFIATFLGKSLKCLLIAYAGHFVLPAALSWLS